MAEVKGVLTGLKLNTVKQKKSGGTFACHLVKVDETTFTINANSFEAKKMVPYLEKLKIGDTVTVCQKDDQYKTVFAVKPEFKKASGSFQKGTYSKTPFVKKEYDASGAIQGMVLNKAIDIAISAKNATDFNAIVHYAKIILQAKSIVDNLVIEHINGKSETKVEVEDDLGDDPDAAFEVTEEDPF